jgi:hypothetical protein
MSEPLELVVHSTGFEHANDMLTKIAANSAAVERATDRMAAHMDASAAREVASAKAAAARMQQTQDQAARQAIEGVKKALMTQEQIVRQSENERRRIILTSTQITEAQRRELLVLSATKTAAELKGINGAGGGMGMMGGMLGMAAVAGVAGAGLGVAKFVGVTREFDRISAGLETATGSAKKADIAFEALSDFAQRTPYSLRETTDSFVKLVNFGLTPSERALTSYGDASAALGRNLNQMIEAVADATVGEFERLKEFGVKARVQGDNINFTFRGMSTTVKNNATDIEEYLIRLGEINFAGAMAKRMATLDGALSNLGDSFDKMMRAIAKSGFEDMLSGWTRGLSTFLDKIGEVFEASRKAEKIRWDRGSKNVQKNVAVRAFEWLGDRFSTDKGDLIDTDKDDLKKSNDIRTSEQKEKDRLAQFGVEKSKILNGRYKDDLDKLSIALQTKRQKIEESFAKEKKIIENGMKVDPVKATAALKRAQEEYAKDIKGLNKKGAKKKDPTSKDAMDFADIEYMRKRDEDAAYRKEVEDYENDSPKVLEGLMGASEKNPTQALLERLERETAAEQKAAEDKKRMHDDVMATFLDDNAKMLEDERRKMEEFQRLRDEDVINADELQQLKVQLHADTNKKLNALEAARVQSSVQSAELLFGNLSEAAKNWGGESSKVYQTMFAAQKAFAIASAGVSMATGMANAMKLPYPANIPAGLAAAAEGARLLALISSTNYSGAHDLGGRIPAGSVGLVGERGPELVRGPADVTSRADTAKMLGGGRSNQTQVNLNFDVHDAFDKYMSSTRGVDTLNVHVRKNWRNIRVASGRT